MNAINVNNVSKIYRLYDKPIDRLKETLLLNKKNYHKEFFALRNVSFNVKKGETIGIIGTNGSGKSTILKIITGVLTPTDGSVSVKGKISALLELGAGFNMEFSGIENVYLNGTMMGYSKQEIDKKLPTILEFADIGDYVKQPVKTYSSGMLVRLAFALAINVEPEILIIDEALAVGDAFFQAKCFNKLEEIKNAGTTILFVSHDIISVKKLCSRAVWISNGVIKDIGDAKSICEKYLSKQIEEQNKQNKDVVKNIVLENTAKDVNERNTGKKQFKLIDKTNADKISETGEAELTSFYIKNEDDQEVNSLEIEKEYKFGLVVKFNKDVENVLFGFEMENIKGVKVFSINNFLNDSVLKKAKAHEIYEVIFSIKLPRLCSGEYLISPSIAAGNQKNHVVIQRIHNFSIISVNNEGYNLSILDIETDTVYNKYNEKNVEFF